MLAAPVVIGIGAYVWLRSAAGQEWLRATAESTLTSFMEEGEGRIGGLSTDLLTRIELSDVQLVDGEGRRVVSADQIGARLDLWGLLRWAVVVPEVEIVGLVGDLRVDEQGALDIVRLFTPEQAPPPPEEPWAGLPIPIELPSIKARAPELSLQAGDQDLLLRDLVLTGAFDARGRRFTLSNLDLRANLVAPAHGPVRIKGGGIWEGDGLEQVELALSALDVRLRIAGSAPDLLQDDGEIDLAVVVEALALTDLDRALELPVRGGLAGEIRAVGPLQSVGIEARLEGQQGLRGGLILRGEVDALRPAFNVELGAQALRLDDLLLDLDEPIELGLQARLRGEPEDSWLGLAVVGDVRVLPMEVRGVAVDGLTTNVTLAQGVVRLDEIDARAPVAQASGQATFDLQSGALSSALTVSRIELMALRHLGVPPELRGTRASAQLEASGNLYEPGLPVTARLTANARPVRWGAEVRVDRVGASLTLDHRHSRVTSSEGKVTADRVLAYGARIERVSVTGLGLGVDELGFSVEGLLQVDEVDYSLIPEVLQADLGEGVQISRLSGPFSASGTFEDLSLPGEAAPGLAPPPPPSIPARLQVASRLEIEDHRLLRFPGTHGTVEVDLSSEALLSAELVLHAPDEREHVDLRATFDLERLALDVEQLILHPMPSQRWSLRPGSGLRIADDETLEDLDFELRSSRGILAAGGRLLGPSAQDLTLSTYDLDLEVVGELLPSLVGGLQGHMGAGLHIGGYAEALEVEGEVEGLDLGWFETDEDGARFPVVRDLGGRLTVMGGEDRLTLRGRLRGLDAPLADLDATVPVQLDLTQLGVRAQDPIHADLQLIPGRLDRLEAVLTGVSLPDAVASGRLRVGGTPVRPVLRWGSALEARIAGLDRPLRFETWLSYEDGLVTTDADVLEGLTRRADLRVTGSSRLAEVLDWALIGGSEPDLSDLELWLSALDGGLELRGVPLDRVAGLSGLDVEVEGELSGEVMVGGSLRLPVTNTDLRLEGGRLGRVEIDEAQVLLNEVENGQQIGVYVVMREQGSSEEGDIYLDGVVPIRVDLNELDPAGWVTGDLDLRPRARLPLALLTAFDPGLERISGYLDLYGALSGHLLDPEPTAILSLSEGSGFGYEPVGVMFSDLSFDADFSPQGITIERFGARTSLLRPRRDPLGMLGRLGLGLGRKVGLFRRRSEPGVGGGATRGRIDATGSAVLDAWNVTDIDVTVSLDRVVMLGTTDQILRVSSIESSPLRVTGDALLPVVRGGVRIDEADVFLDYATALGGGPTTVDPRIKVNRGDRVVATPPPEDSLFDDIDIEVKIDLGRTTRGRLSMPIESLGFLGQTATSLTQIDLRARLGGNLLFRQVPCRVRDSELGVVAVPARKGSCGLFHPQAEGAIDIVEGQARVLRADFDLQDSRISFFGNEVFNPTLDIKGKMVTGDVTIDMRVSGTAFEPDVDFTSADSDQIFATLLLGTSPDALGSQGASQLAFAAAMTAFQSVLSGANLGTFSVEPSGQIAWGMAVARDLYVEGTIGGTPRPDQNTFEIEIEYMILRNLIGRVGFGAYAIPFWSDLLIERRFD